MGTMIQREKLIEGDFRCVLSSFLLNSDASALLFG
jgi:hypothetical protein